MLSESLNKWLNIDPIEIINEILSRRSMLQWIEERNKEQLFEKNQDSLGKQLVYKGIYKGYSVLYYNKLNGVKKNGVPFNIGDPYTIANTGDFYKSIIAQSNLDLVEINADPIKIDEFGNKTNLFEAFGKDILGLNDENLQELIEMVKDELIIEILKKV